MLITRFLVRSIWYYRKQYLALLAGTAIATAALTGALMLGDSVKYSLVRLADLRLGKTQLVITSGSRFFRSQLAYDIGSSLHSPATPILLLRGIAIHPGTDLRLNSVQVTGVDTGISVFSFERLPSMSRGEALLSQNTAKALNLKKGDPFLLRVEKTGLIPENAIFSRKDVASAALRLTVAGIIKDSTLGRFSLKNNQSAPFNIFVSREFLANRLQLDSLANVILLASELHQDLQISEVRSVLKKCWKLQDASLRISMQEKSGIFDLTSTRVFLDDTVSAILSGLKMPHTTILTYLVNSIGHGEKQTPYSFITASSPPLIPELPEDGIIVNRWLSDDLDAGTGDTLSIDFYTMGPFRGFTTGNSKFVIRGIIPTDGSITARSLMPSIPGLSEAGSCRDWNSGVPIDLKRIRDKDENYWNEYRGSPKAYISYGAGKALWKNHFGSCTAIRFHTRDISAGALITFLMAKLNPSDLGIEVIPAREAGKVSATNSVDFGQLFLYLSFFIITGGLVLTVLIHSLNSATRIREGGILAGLGYTKRQIILMRLMESMPVLFAGGLAGALIGIAYNYGLLAGLKGFWQNTVHTDALRVQIRPVTWVTGTVAGIFLALLTTGWVTRQNLKNPVYGLLKEYSGLVGKTPWAQHRLSGITGLTLAAISLVLVSFSLVSGSFQNAGLFLSAGGLFLAGIVFILDYFMGKSAQNAMPVLSIRRLAIKNAGRRRGRSLAVIIILALGVFALMITGSYRRTFFGAENLVKSGTGGYQLWAETTLPLSVNLNSEDGRNQLIVDKENDLDSVHFIQFHLLEGDDASCMNLNQVQKPRILGIPVDEFARREAFSFVRFADGIERGNPWKVLEISYDHNTYPAFADQTVIQYGLKKSLGDTLTYINEKGKPFRLILAGGLDNSVFQGNILVADPVLISQFPSIGGSRVMLVDAPPDKQERISGILRNSLPDYGIEVTSTADRLAGFNSVENAYLSVFMMLGGLGILLGTCGLGIVLLRNMLERKREIALLTAMGYRKKDLIQLIFTEYSYLLFAGVASGTFSAFIGIMPSILSPEFSLHPGFLALMIVIITLSGFFWIYVTTRYFLRQNLSMALRED